jgi:steroid 5-alpha reductase family enzyme
MDIMHVRAMLHVGSKQLTVFECAVAYSVPLLLMFSSADELKALLWGNFLCQLALFIVVVQIPLALTGIMAYVDIGWPFGLIVLGANGLLYGHGWYVRRYAVSLCMIAHGARMLIGALVLFFPYTFRDGDLSRYRYARHRWVVEGGLSPALWPLKAQLDTLTQCFANSVMLACPILLACSNPLPEVHPLELLGLAVWALAWAVETLADVQKIFFVQEARAAGRAATAVLGVAPYAGGKFWLWGLCRHPNYFCEWVAWVGFAAVGLGSVSTSWQWMRAMEGVSGTYTALVLVLTHAVMIRFFYGWFLLCWSIVTGIRDCLHCYPLLYI